MTEEIKSKVKGALIILGHLILIIASFLQGLQKGVCDEAPYPTHIIPQLQTFSRHVKNYNNTK